ncbi:uncharacterized protein PAC_18581 [Phialocephala subalpina]|uniref:CHAT domain-containing protein n=1 Tax=Phialocephala subalpina TaxID=576137 RepID=A0A1L7XUH8_9HELO|nr:uncharacterized protein PAC_18581 [Phialocephala subalpina]
MPPDSNYSEKRHSTEYTGIYVISSYSPTIKALSIARKTDIIPLHSQEHHFAIPAMRKTVHMSDLGVDNEISTIRRSIKDLEEDSILVNQGKEPVMGSLEACAIAHFACHGISDAQNPSNSALLLGTESASKAERLTIADLANESLYKAQIAYLSACSTAQSPDLDLANEMIHIASTFQLMGFSHVIGTL